MSQRVFHRSPNNRGEEGIKITFICKCLLSHYSVDSGWEMADCQWDGVQIWKKNCPSMKNVEVTVSEVSRTLASGALLPFRLALSSSLLRPQIHPQLSFHPAHPFCIALDTMVMVSTLSAQCQVCFFRLGYDISFFVFKRLKVLFEGKYEHEFFLFLKFKLVFSFLIRVVMERSGNTDKQKEHGHMESVLVDVCLLPLSSLFVKWYFSRALVHVLHCSQCVKSCPITILHEQYPGYLVWTVCIQCPPPFTLCLTVPSACSEYVLEVGVTWICSESQIDTPASLWLSSFAKSVSQTPLAFTQPPTGFNLGLY